MNEVLKNAAGAHLNVDLKHVEIYSQLAAMIVERMELVDFRNYRSATFDLTPGITAVLGKNGQGKTNLAEALAYLATLSSFRGAPPDALLRAGADAAILRATLREDDGREVLIEAELSRVGRNRVQVNKQKLGRVRDLLGVMRVSVFAPDDLVIVKGGPAERRRLLDDTEMAVLRRLVEERSLIMMPTKTDDPPRAATSER